MFNIGDIITTLQKSQISNRTIASYIKNKCNASMSVTVMRKHKNMVGFFP